MSDPHKEGSTAVLGHYNGRVCYFVSADVSVVPAELTASLLKNLIQIRAASEGLKTVRLPSPSLQTTFLSRGLIPAL